jgi:hypothetical protein
MNQKYKFVYLLFFFFVFVLFAIRGNIILDPDFGWHLRMGELVLKQGIPQTDPFSYTMSSFPFVDHEWLANIGMYGLNIYFGKLGLSIIFSLLVVTFLFFNFRFPEIKNVKGWEYFGKRYYPLALLLLSVGILLPFCGVRPQVISWILLFVLLKIVTSLPKTRKWFFLLPFYFLFWANIHGSFAVGIFTLFMVISVRVLFSKKIIVSECVIAFLCLVITFVNPYGWRLWGEVWMQISDTSLRWWISEWMPAIFFLNYSYLVLIVLSGLVVYGFRKRIKPESMAVYLFFLFQSVLSVRHIPLWLAVSLPMVCSQLEVFIQSLSKIKYGLRRFGQMTAIFLSLSALFLVIQIVLSNPNIVSEESAYPQKAVNYLKTNLPEKEIFSEYGWGGYLIRHLPEKKVFIDGRMPSWRWEKSIDNESNNAMNEYMNLLSGKISYEEVFQKYGVKTVLWPKPKDVGYVEKVENKINRFFKKLMNKQGEDTDFDLVTSLSKDGWQKIYEDKVAVIYEAPKGN